MHLHYVFLFGFNFLQIILMFILRTITLLGICTQCEWGSLVCLVSVSLLSYLFKKFEREVFIFGIIIIVALFAGPYYNEHRFSKYVMVGMIGFASLMIFKLLDFARNKKPVVNGVLIASIVIAASLSTLYILAIMHWLCRLRIIHMHSGGGIFLQRLR